MHAIREAISGPIKAPWRRARAGTHRSGYSISRGPHEKASRPDCSLIASLMKARARTPPSAPRADDGASRPPACNEGGNHQLSRGSTSHSEATFDDCLPHQLKRRMQRRHPWLPKMVSNLGLIWVQSVSNLVPIWVPICVHLVRQPPRHTARHRGRGEQVNSERLLLPLQGMPSEVIRGHQRSSEVIRGH
jgi:hypothetical protein